MNALAQKKQSEEKELSKVKKLLAKSMLLTLLFFSLLIVVILFVAFSFVSMSGIGPPLPEPDLIKMVLFLAGFMILNLINGIVLFLLGTFDFITAFAIYKKQKTKAVATFFAGLLSFFFGFTNEWRMLDLVAVAFAIINILWLVSIAIDWKKKKKVTGPRFKN